MRKASPYVIAVTLLVLLEGLFLGSFLFPPSLFIVAILIASAKPKHGLWLALWGGLLMDGLSLQPPGVYLLLALGLFKLSLVLQKQGLDIARFLNLSTLVFVLSAAQFAWLLVVLLLQGYLNETATLLVLPWLIQTAITGVVAFWTIRFMKVQ